MIVGLTGGIGAGKSTVAHIFQFLGVPVYEADTASKRLIDQDKLLQQELVLVLGEGIVKNGLIDRPLMASRIFNNKALLNKVNQIIHPVVGRDFKAWVGEQDFPYLIKEAAILFESGSYKQCDKVITVFADEEIRIKRVMERNGFSREQVLERMSKQWQDDKRTALADYVIFNNNTRSIIKQVLKVHEDLIHISGSGS